MSDWIDAEQSVERAHEFYERGRWAEAESHLRRALSVNPYQAEWHFNLGLTLEAAGRHREAADAFIEASELQPGESAGAVSAGANLIRAGDPAQSLELLDRAERSGADAAVVAVHRIEAFTDLGRHDEAETAFYIGVEHAEDDAELYATMGDCLLDQGEHERALWCLRRAATLDPDLPEIDIRLAAVFERSGRFERARQMYMRHLRSDPGDVDALLDLAKLLQRMNRAVEAGEKLRRVLELEPRCGEAHALLSDLAEDQATAISEMDVAVRLDPKVPGGRRRLASLLTDRRGVGDAERVDELIAAELTDFDLASSFDTEAAAELVDLCLDAGRPRDAAQLAKRLCEESPDDLQAAHLLSVAMLEAGDLRTGMEVARKIVRRAPRFLPAMYNLALAHMRRGEWLRARYWVNQARQVDCEDGSIRRLRVRLWYRAALGVGAATLRLAWSGVLLLTTPARRPRRSPAPNHLPTAR
ncbi:MAG: hypothetical protein CMJ31_12785 [Phycisphaerae bacterium]|nr:hypothetical protein [Phycisphaerae bacterium]